MQLHKLLCLYLTCLSIYRVNTLLVNQLLILFTCIRFPFASLFLSECSLMQLSWFELLKGSVWSTVGHGYHGWGNKSIIILMTNLLNTLSLHMQAKVLYFRLTGSLFSKADNKDNTKTSAHKPGLRKRKSNESFQESKCNLFLSCILF